MRIIAGEFRGRRLSAPKGLATRPTTDRVREAWFSMLGPLEGTALDLYAGTGALGFEALSRGAKRVVFVESARPAQLSIEKNAETLGVSDRVVILRTGVESSLPALRQHGPFDLVLTDPPWTDLERAGRALGHVLRSELFREGGRLVLGHPRGRPLAPAENSGLSPVKSRHWGDSAATFFVFDPESPPV